MYMVETPAQEGSDDEQFVGDDPERADLLKEHLSESSKCSECGDPVDNLRKTCPNCGHEYAEDELDDDQAGNEFKAGAALDDEGNEITDEDVLEE